ncbi:unnamed protein product [Ilex paraguariensis]|uniref:Uncharacterized protein n=1 Tax=Ilex paraguariensis TaxID=185542 RepID=A0ABC8R1T6_9AQUA
MEMRFSKNLSSKSAGSVSLQKKIAETKISNRPEPAPDLTDFMNDMFFGSVSIEKKAYNLTGGLMDAEEEEDFESSRRSSVYSRSNHEWLEEAKRMVANSSPSRNDSPSRPVRFASPQARLSASNLDRRDPLSRSARRNRAVDKGFSGEILSKSTKQTLNNPKSFDQPPPAEISPASAVQKWFSNILKLPNHNPPPHSSDRTKPHPTDLPTTNSNHTVPLPPPRQSTHRKSRFQDGTNATQPQTIPPHSPSKRTFKTTTTNSPAQDTQLLSPPKHLIQSANRRSISSSTCSVPERQVLSPPRNLVESARRKSMSSSTCSTDRNLQKPTLGERFREEDTSGRDLNGFLKEQRIKFGKILSGEINEKAKIVLSGPSNSTSSMVAAICYAWLLENRVRNNEGGEGDESVVPVMNMRRGKMWKQRQAAWLFLHVGVDATALLFSDEVDLETKIMSNQLTILVVGEDILKTNGEVGSQCTILTDNYCELAYDQLQIPVIKKLLVSDQLQIPVVKKLLDQRDGNFFEALRQNYGKPPNERTRDSGTPVEHRISERESHQEPIVQNAEKKSNDFKTARVNTASPKSESLCKTN